MAKEFKNDFYTELESQVIGSENNNKGKKDKLDDLKELREQLIIALDEAHNNGVGDPKVIEDKLKEVERAIEEGELEITLETDEAKLEVEADKAEEQEQIVEEKIETNNSEIEEENRDDKLKEQYHEALVALHSHRIDSIERAKELGSLLVSDEAFKEEVELEEKMYRLRDEYMSLGHEDLYKEERDKFRAEEQKAKEDIEIELREMARKFKEYEIELARINKAIQEITEELNNNSELTVEEIENKKADLAKYETKRKEIEDKISEVRAKLEPAVETRINRELERYDLINKEYESLSYEDKANFRYQNSRNEKMQYNTETAQKQELENIKIRIERCKENKKKLLKELGETPKTDFERRIELLDMLEKNNLELEQAIDDERDIKNGVQLTETERKQEIANEYKLEEERKEQFDKDLATAQDVVEEKEKVLAEKAVEEPSQSKAEEKERETNEQATLFAVVADNPHKDGPDTITDDVVQFAGAKCVIEGLEEEVRDPNNLEDAEAMIESEKKIEKEKIEKANKELEEKEEKLTKNI